MAGCETGLERIRARDALDRAERAMAKWTIHRRFARTKEGEAYAERRLGLAIKRRDKAIGVLRRLRLAQNWALERGVD